ncbi:permease [gamma proteobacterium HTCC5015]|nr:permease [gamma proteobacterium HTCC5015]
MNVFIEIAQAFTELFLESAPWLILGLLVAGFMKAFVPAQLLAKHLGEHGVMSTIKAALLGAPLPLCSCGVIPAAVGLRRSGASKNSTVSFLISTPETGVDSISISYALLGPFMAIVRPIAAVFSAITAGLLVGNDEGEKTVPEKEPEAESSCCSQKKAPEAPASSLIQRVKSGLHFTFNDLIDDIALWLFIGLGMAALIQVFVPETFLTRWGDGVLAFVVMAVIGVPMYICATASTPIAAGLLLSGVSPGTVLVFMLAGPATNMATLGVVWRELGRRALAAYLSGVVIVAFIFGYITNWAADYFSIDFIEQSGHAHQLVPSPLVWIASAVLALLMARSFWRKCRPAQAACH